MPDPFANAYTASETPADTQARLRREAFRPDPAMERLAQLKTDQPARYDLLPAAKRVALGIYLASKQAAETGKPVPTSRTFPSDDEA
ncbi:hypothetical protein AB0G04_02555 [Actinoplanes sp. NPDC023801]|uniref:hypothetical protein n=1 Tax=Actinoplanes sp. NPDC023801 TaxID=3154595 RepID=UPI0033FB19A7